MKTQNLGPADNISHIAVLFSFLFAFLLFSVPGSLMITKVPPLYRTLSEYQGRRIRKKCWGRLQDRSSTIGNIREDCVNCKMSSIARSHSTDSDYSNISEFQPSSQTPASLLVVITSWGHISFHSHLPVVSCSASGSHRCPIASYAFSPPCFACCFALAPRRFLFHVPCLANSYAQHRRSNSSPSCLKNFLRWHQPLPVLCFSKSYIMRP